MTAEIVEAGAAAWERLKSRERKSWPDWLAVARSIEIGRASALKVAVSNKPVGTRYNKAMGAWLRGNGLSGITAQERYRLLLILDNLPEIERWHDNLPPEKMRRLNHPNAIWACWKASQRKTSHTLHVASVSATNGGERPVCFTQDMIRRLADALLTNRTPDLYKKANELLIATFPNRVTAAQLLEDGPRAKMKMPAPVPALVPA
jgi:hypothetical protein